MGCMQGTACEPDSNAPKRHQIEKHLRHEEYVLFTTYFH
jgi:hypothetical protein